MKKLIIAIAVIALVVLVPPYFIGSKVETVFRDQMAQAKQSPTMNMSLKEYQRGWLGSQAKLSILIPNVDEQGQENDIEFTIIQNMQHGPLLWQSGSLGFGLVDSDIDFELPADIRAELEKHESINEDTLTITGRTAFDISSTINVALKPFVIKEEKGTVKINGAEGFYSYTMAGKIDGNMHWKGMQVDGTDGVKAVMSEMTMNMDSELISGDLFAADALFGGDFSMTLAQLEVTTRNPLESFKLNDLTLKVATDIQPETTDITSNIKVKSITALAQDFSDLVYDFSIEKIDTESLKAFNSMIAQAQASTQPDPAVFQNQMQALLPDLVAKGPEVKIKQLGVKTAQGDIASNMLIKINQDMYEPQNPMSMIFALDAKANGQGPLAFFNTLGMGPMIEQLVGQNMLVKNNELVEFEFVYQQGQALMNGAPMQLGM